MPRNNEIEWLRTHNTSLPPDTRKTGFYGLDLYSLHASIEAVISYLEKVDPEAAKRARYRYSCFGHYERKLYVVLDSNEP